MVLSFGFSPGFCLLIYFLVSERNYTITVEAGDHGKPIRSATALIHILLAEPEKPVPAPSSKHPPLERSGSVLSTASPSLEQHVLSTLSPPLEQPRSILENLQANSNQQTTNPEKKRVRVDSIEKELEDRNGTLEKDEKLGRMFRKDVYSVQVFENTDTPLVILSLGRELEGEMAGVHFRIVGSNYGMFRIEEKTGELVLTSSPDREQRDTYILRIKVV